MKLSAAAVVALVLLSSMPSIAQQNVPQSSAAQQPASTAAAAAAAASSQTSAPPAPNILLDGTPVKLRLAETVSSADAQVGQQVPFEVTEEVDVDGVPVIAKGGEALATVTAAEPRRRMGRAGKLDINIDSVRLIDNQKAQLRATKDAKGGSHTGAMTGAMVATALVFFPAAPLFLFMKGKDITIPKGTQITAFVQGDMRLNMANFQTPGASPAPGMLAVASAQASLTVDSNVPGADITVDGSFMGNTPSTVSVVPGQHTIVVSKKGYADWQRTMMVAGSAVHLSADLEAKP